MATNPSRRHRRGNAATVALSFMVLLGCAALVVDVGYLYTSHVELQASVDASALAGVGSLDGSAAGLGRAIADATTYARSNDAGGLPVVLDGGDIELGFVEDGVFHPSADPAAIDAMRVTNDHALPTLFAGIAFGREGLAIGASSTARRTGGSGAGRVSCYLPITMPDCVLKNPQAFQGMALRLSSANVDNAAWADGNGNPTPGAINQGLMTPCGRGDAWVGGPIYMNNGTIASSLSKLAEVLSGQTQAVTSPWNAAAWGPIPPQMPGSTVTPSKYGKSVVQGPIALFQSPPGACGSKTQFNKSQKITGFTWGVLYDVDSHGGDKNIRVKLDLTTEYPVGTGRGGLKTNVVSPGTGGLVR